MARTPIAGRERCCFVVLLLVALWLPAQSRATPVADFQAGMKAYSAGDFTAAARAFERARAGGLDRPALDYNLGSTYYRLGDYERARLNFERLLSVPALRPLAHYNLGLVQDQVGNPAQAREHYRIAYDSSDDERLRYLARRRLAPDQGPVETNPRDWQAYASLAVGYDDNVNFAPTDMPTYQGDQFAEAYLFGSGVLSGSRADGFSAHASYYSLKYQDVSENNFDEAWVMVRRDATLGEWRTYAGGFALHDQLDGDSYQRGFGVEASARRTLSADRYLNFRYVFEDVDALDSRYDYLTGYRQELRAEYALYKQRDNLRFAYELELNNRRDTAFESYSPTRHTVRAYYSRDLSADWRLRADASYRLSDYPSAPALNREDKRWRTRISASHDFAKDWRIKGQWEYINNNSNDPLRDYERNVYSLQLEWLY